MKSLYIIINFIGLLAGPVGWITLGTETTQGPEQFTWDCWKPVLRDATVQPSKGKLLREIFSDPRIKTVSSQDVLEEGFPAIVVENVWNEKFQIEFLTLPNNMLAAHAAPLQ
jgi:hypothetical protein